MTARFATLADATAFRTNLNAWRQSVAQFYDAEALQGLTLAQVRWRVQNERVVIDAQPNFAVAAVALGTHIPAWMPDGKPGAHISEILANPAIAVGSRVAALGTFFTDLRDLLRPLGETRIIGEDFDDSPFIGAMKNLAQQGIVPMTVVGQAQGQTKADGTFGTLDFIEVSV